jgi:hypothetical protein
MALASAMAACDKYRSSLEQVRGVLCEHSTALRGVFPRHCARIV